MQAGDKDRPQRPDRERGTRGGRGRERHVPAGEEHKRPQKGPAGIERAERRSDAPPRPMINRGGGGKGPRPSATEPPLADDAPVDIPRGIRRDIERATSDKETAKRLQQHLTAAFAALDHRDGATALPHLRYLKARLPRTGLLREALGVALYLHEDYKEALSELQAYRRLTGSSDQNHLVADAIRAVGEGEHRIPELIQEMEAGEEPAPDAARFEGRIVWACYLADSGDLGAGRAVLAPLLEEKPDDEPEEHHLRCWYVAADLAARAGDRESARDLFTRISDHADSFFDTEQRLAALG